MTRFSEAELAGMQAAQEGHMMDRCTVDVYTEGATDVLGNKSITYPSGAEMWCGLQLLTPGEALDQGADAPVIDARLRLPISVTVTSKDRVTITRRHGVDVTDMTFEVVGEMQRGPSGLVLNLRKVTDV